MLDTWISEELLCTDRKYLILFKFLNRQSVIYSFTINHSKRNTMIDIRFNEGVMLLFLDKLSAISDPSIPYIN